MLWAIFSQSSGFLIALQCQKIWFLQASLGLLFMLASVKNWYILCPNLGDMNTLVFYMSLLLRWAIFRQSGGFSFASCFACSGIVDLHFHEPAKGFSLSDSGLWLDVCGWWIRSYLVEPKQGDRVTRFAECLGHECCFHIYSCFCWSDNFLTL